MQPLSPVYIGAYDKGLMKNKKPFALPDRAFSELENAYVWRDRVKKREGLKLLGRLQRNLAAVLLTTTVSGGGAGTVTFNIFTGLIPAVVSASEPNKEIKPGLSTSPIVIVLGAPANITLTDSTGTGLFVITGGGSANFSSASINYSTGVVSLVTLGAFAASTITVTLSYYPGLPVMGIRVRELTFINNEETVFFDTRYAYRFNGTVFEEYSTVSVTWNGTDSDFFSEANYRGSTPQSKAFFITNFNNAATPDPIRYTLNGTSWNSFAPLVDATHTLFQARVLIPYYGRLLALNVWEGLTADPQNLAVNISNRCRFSAIGDPLAADAWRTDIFGKGGFIDAPVNEAIVSAIFYKNTLIVGFERSTWQLRYVGEYGIPFIWERISSDFGTESTFSAILFDDGVLSIGDKAIVISNGVNVKRLDVDIPDEVFLFKNAAAGPERIQGIRDFKRELVYWSFVDSSAQQPNQNYPDSVLVYNYRNQTWATFRDNVTAFGTIQKDVGISWDSLTVFWDDEVVTWDDPQDQSGFPFILAGNQQGFIHQYGYTTPDNASLSIAAINLTTTPIRLTIPNHNLEDGEIIFLSNIQFLDSTGTTSLSTDLNDKTYQVQFITKDIIGILKWDTDEQLYVNDFDFTPVTTALYVGGGLAALYPLLYVQTKDFSPFLEKGMQLKMSYIDFLMDATPSAAMSVQLFLNSSMSVQGNLLVGNKEVETSLTSPYYVPESEYAWHRFFATLAGQFIRVVITYDDDLMNLPETHKQLWTMNAMTLWVRPGGKNVF